MDEHREFTWSLCTTALLEAQLAGDRKRATAAVLSAYERSGSYQEVLNHVLRPAQREVGRRWEANEIGVADEHVATAVAQVALVHLYDRAQRRVARAGRMVVSCPEGELHGLPARLLADSLDVAGYEVSFLGANVPTDGLVEYVRLHRPHLVALSLTYPENAGALEQAVLKLRALQREDLALAAGGGAFERQPGLADHLSLNATAISASAFLPMVARLLTPTRGAEPK